MHLDEYRKGQILCQTEKAEIDAAIIGCPLLTTLELLQIEKLLGGRELKKPLWLYCDYVVADAARRLGIIDKIEATGAKVVHSCCPGTIQRDPIIENDVFVTDSLKAIKLCSGIGWQKWFFGQRKDVVEAAVGGKFRCPRW